MRISVRPFAVRWATMKAISTNVHSTMSSAKPPLRRQSKGCAPTRRGKAHKPFGLATLPNLPLRWDGRFLDS